MDRKCDECGTFTIQDLLQPLLQMDESVTFYMWEIVPYQQNGAEKKKMCRLRKTVSPQDFVQELVKEVTPFSAHLFNASWQGRKYEEISRDSPGGWVVICQDFAENYTCWFQDELKRQEPTGPMSRSRSKPMLLHTSAMKKTAQSPPSMHSSLSVMTVNTATMQYMHSTQ